MLKQQKLKTNHISKKIKLKMMKQTISKNKEMQRKEEKKMSYK